jgi:hypothetical protein
MMSLFPESIDFGVLEKGCEASILFFFAPFLFCIQIAVICSYVFVLITVLFFCDLLEVFALL